MPEEKAYQTGKLTTFQRFSTVVQWAAFLLQLHGLWFKLLSVQSFSYSLVSSHKHASMWIGNSKLPLGVNEFVNAMEWHPIQDVFLPCIQKSRDGLQVHSHLTQDKVLTKDV